MTEYTFSISRINYSLHPAATRGGSHPVKRAWGLSLALLMFPIYRHTVQKAISQNMAECFALFVGEGLENGRSTGLLW